MIVGKVTSECAFGSEHRDASGPTEEDRIVVDVAPKCVVRVLRGDDSDRIDAYGGPERVLGGRVGDRIGGLDVVRIVGVICIVVGLDVRVLVGDIVDVDDVLGRGDQFGFGDVDGGGVDIGRCDDRIQRIDDGVPALGDRRADTVPEILTVLADIGLDAHSDRAEVRIVGEEGGDLVEFADITEGLDHFECCGQLGEGIRVGVLGDELRHADQVEAVKVVRLQFVGCEGRYDRPRRMIHEIVVVVGSDERGELGDCFEGVKIFLVTEERLPFVIAFAPFRSPQGDEVAASETEFDRDDVASHGRKPISGLRE